eukprot:jgi/Mesvir1/20760/Mv12766-RA.1
MDFDFTSMMGGILGGGGSSKKAEATDEAASSSEAQEDVANTDDDATPLFSGLGSMFSSIAGKSTKWLEGYTHDLAEFAHELKEDTDKAGHFLTTPHKLIDLDELPGIMEKKAGMVQENIASVSTKLEHFGDSVWRGTAEIVHQVKEVVKDAEESMFPSEAIRGVDRRAPHAKGRAGAASGAYGAAASTGKYSRFDAQVLAMQRDSATYCDEPEDAEDYGAWQATFKLEDKEEDIRAVVDGNAFMQELQSRIVPLIVERRVFWCRYFYRLHRLQLAEASRAELVKRAASTQAEEEEIGWGNDDEDDEGGAVAEGGAAEGDALPKEAQIKEGATGLSEAAVSEVEASEGAPEEGGGAPVGTGVTEEEATSGEEGVSPAGEAAAVADGEGRSQGSKAALPA